MRVWIQLSLRPELSYYPQLLTFVLCHFVLEAELCQCHQGAMWGCARSVGAFVWMFCVSSYQHEYKDPPFPSRICESFQPPVGLMLRRIKRTSTKFDHSLSTPWTVLKKTPPPLQRVTSSYTQFSGRGLVALQELSGFRVLNILSKDVTTIISLFADVTLNHCQANPPKPRPHTGSETCRKKPPKNSRVGDKFQTQRLQVSGLGSLYRTSKVMSVCSPTVWRGAQTSDLFTSHHGM